MIKSIWIRKILCVFMLSAIVTSSNYGNVLMPGKRDALRPQSVKNSTTVNDFYPAVVEIYDSEIPHEEWMSVSDVKTVLKFSKGPNTDEFTIDGLEYSGLLEEERAMLKPALTNWIKTLKKNQQQILCETDIPLLVSSTIGRISAHRSGVIEIHRAILHITELAKETTQQRQLFLNGVVYHEGYHLFNPIIVESIVTENTIEYICQNPDMLDATLAVLDRSNPNFIYAQRLVQTLTEIKYGFDKERFADIQKSYKQGDLSVASASFKEGTVTPYPSTAITKLPASNTIDYLKFEKKGTDIIASGKLAVCALSGGMATRFRGAAKDTEVKGLFRFLSLPSHNPKTERTFLGLKLGHTRWAREKYGTEGRPARIIQLLHNSFFTDNDIRWFLRIKGFSDMKEGENLFMYNAGMHKRLIPTKEDIETKYKGRVSAEQIEAWAEGAGKICKLKDWIEGYNPPGHGDAVRALISSGTLDKLIESGVEYIWFSNIDNLGALIDPVELGLLAGSSKDMLTEVAKKYPGDKGGAPAMVNGRMQIVEQFAMPKDLDQNKLPEFNPATYIVKVSALQRIREKILGDGLPLYVSIKEVQDEGVSGNKMVSAKTGLPMKRPFAQLEMLLGDLTALLDSEYLLVEREERFLPVKSREDLEAGHNVEFSVSAPNAQKVTLVINNSKPIELIRKEDSVFTAKPFLNAGKHVYEYIADGESIGKYSITVLTKRGRLQNLLDDKVDMADNDVFSLKTSSAGVSLADRDLEHINLAAEIANLTDATGTVVYNDTSLSLKRQQMFQSLIGTGTPRLAELEAKLGCSVKLMSQGGIEDNANTIIISTEELSNFKNAKYFITEQTQIDTSYVAIAPLIAIAKGLLGLESITEQSKLYTALKSSIKSLSRGLLNERDIEAAITSYINGNPMLIELPPAETYDYDQLEQLQRLALMALIAA